MTISWLMSFGTIIDVAGEDAVHIGLVVLLDSQIHVTAAASDVSSTAPGRQMDTTLLIEEQGVEAAHAIDGADLTIAEDDQADGHLTVAVELFLSGLVIVAPVVVVDQAVLSLDSFSELVEDAGVASGQGADNALVVHDVEFHSCFLSGYNSLTQIKYVVVC